MNLNARLHLTGCVSVNIGYNLLFLTNVYRSGNQIDRAIDPGYLPGSMPINGTFPNDLARPTTLLDSSTLCVQGMNVGFTVSY